MDLHISAHSNALLPRTNIRDCDVKVVPYDLDLEKRAKLALGDCVHSNEYYHKRQNIEFYFYACAFPSKKNFPYLLVQLLKDQILEHRLDVEMFFELVRKMDPHLERSQKDILGLFVRLRFFHVVGQQVSTLCVRRQGIWDVHFIQSTYEKLFCLDQALVEPKQTRYFWKNRVLWKPKLIRFLKKTISNKIGFSSNMEKIGQFVTFGQTSFDWSFAINNRPTYYIALQGEFDADALLIWHMVLLDDYLDECKFVRVFEEEIDAFKHTFGLDHLKRQLMNIPDVWHRAVPQKYKDRFRLGT